MRTVLLVDDDPVQVRIREAILRDAGLDVHVTTSPVAAIEQLRADSQHDIGVVLTDHMMPEISGTEFVRELRRIAPKLPVIVVSGLADAESEYNGLGVIFRQKPCPPPELILLVTRSLKPAA